MDNEFFQHIIEIKESQARTETKVEAIEKELLGNGQPGIKQRVEELEGSKRHLYGIGAAITFLGTIFEYLVHTLSKGGTR